MSKPSYRELKNHVKRGREMVYRLGQEVEKRNEVIRNQESMVRSAMSIIAVMAEGKGRIVEVSKAEISNAMQKYAVRVNQDENSYFLIIEDAEVSGHAEQQTEREQGREGMVTDMQGSGIQGSEEGTTV